MKKKYKVLGLLVMLLIIVFAYKTYFFTFDHLGEGIYFKGPYKSPSGKYRADSYFKNYGGATGGANVWVKIIDLETDEEQTIYYSDGKSYFSIQWKDDDTILIRNDDGTEYPNSDRSAELKVGKEIYDERGRACKSLLMKKDYESCYQNTSR